MKIILRIRPVRVIADTNELSLNSVRVTQNNLKGEINNDDYNSNYLKSCSKKVRTEISLRLDKTRFYYIGGK